MKKTILEDKVYYYEDAIQNFDEVMATLKELDDLGPTELSPLWQDWSASDDKSYIYGKTQVFDLSQIRNMEEPYRAKSEFVYVNIMQSMFDVCRDYATNIGDTDEPRLFPVFNIKKYDTGSAMGAHYDQLDGDKTLRYSIVIYLNDDCEGGEISFKLSEYEDHTKVISPSLDYDVAVKNNEVDFGVKPSAGSMIIFPSSAPYYHIAHTVKSGFKYMIPGHWIHNEMEFKDGSCSI